MLLYIVDNYILRFTIDCLCRPDSWPSGNAFVYEARGLIRLKSQSSQIEQSAAKVLPPLCHCLKGAMLPARNDAEMDQQLIKRIGLIRRVE